MSKSHPALPESLNCYTEGNLAEGVVLELENAEGLARKFRFRIAHLDDLEAINEVQQSAWPEELAFSSNEIEGDMEMFPGLQLIVTDEETLQPVACAMIGKIDTHSEGVDLLNANDWDDTVLKHASSNGDAYEGLDLSRIKDIRGYGIGKVLIIFGARLVARNLVLEGRNSAIFRATSRLPKYGSWLDEQGLDPSSENLQRYVELIRSGDIHDSALSAHFQVERITEGLVEVLTPLERSWPKDNASKGAGVRVSRQRLAEAFIPAEEVLIGN